MREDRITESIKHKNLPSDMQFGEMGPGHHITGAPILYHKLSQQNDKKHYEPFVLHMLERELDTLLKGSPSFNASDVAILLDGGFKSGLDESIPKLIQQKQGFGVQTIEDFILTGNKDNVVLDGVDNAMSYEVPCVLYILTRRRTGVNISLFNYRYVIASRARARLTIIDGHVADPPIPIPDVTLVTWEEKNGSFLIP